jgi:hypothetical protein
LDAPGFPTGKVEMANDMLGVCFHHKNHLKSTVIKTMHYFLSFGFSSEAKV